MEKHGGNQSKRQGNRRVFIKDLPGEDLIGDGSPLKNEALTLDDIQGDLVEKDPAIGQDEPDSHNGKGQGGVVVFQGDEQNSAPRIPVG